MTDQLPEEVFIVGYRYRDNADDVSKLFKLNRPIDKNDIIEVFGDDSAFLKPVESDIDPYCVAVYDIETKHIGYVWMLQAPTMRRWMETHNEDFISIRITGTIPAANVLLGVMEEPLDVPMTNREFNAFDPSWASNLPGILRGDSEECLDMQLKLLCKELSKAKKWNKIFEKSISNLFKSIPLDLSSYRHNTYMELFVKMRNSEIKEVREKSDEMLNTLLYRGSKEYMKWWTEEWLTEYFRKVSEGHLFKLFEAAHYTLDIVEDLLEEAPANLYHLYKADKIEFVRRLYYYALPKDAYNRLLTLLAVREALLEKGKSADVPETIVPNNAFYASLYETYFGDDIMNQTIKTIQPAFEKWREDFDATEEDEKWKRKVTDHIYICMAELFKSGFLNHYDNTLTEEDKEKLRQECLLIKCINSEHTDKFLNLYDMVDIKIDNKGVKYRPSEKKIGRYLYKHIKEINQKEINSFRVFLANLYLHQDALTVKPKSQEQDYDIVKFQFKKFLTESKWIENFVAEEYDDNYVDQLVDELLSSEYKDQIAVGWQKPASREKMKGHLLGSLLNAGVLTGKASEIARKYIGKKNKDAENFADYISEGKKKSKCKYSDWVYEYVNE